MTLNLGIQLLFQFQTITFPETNIARFQGTLSIGNTSSNHPFSGAMLVSGRVHPGKINILTTKDGGLVQMIFFLQLGES